MDQRLKGRITIITGAASGIGKACALRFAREGAIVYANDINADGVVSVVREIESAGGRAIAHPADVTQAAEVARLVDRTVAEQGRLDILFNNAGGALPKRTHETSLDEYHTIIALNLNAVFYGVHAALPVMMRQKSGVMLTTSSGAGMNAVADLAIYGAAKAAVINLMRNIAVEYGSYGIRANTIAPGPMDTPGLRSFLATLPGGADPFTSQVPSGRLGTGDDIAGAAVFLASEDATYINGAVLPVDGAVHARLASPRPDLG